METKYNIITKVDNKNVVRYSGTTFSKAKDKLIEYYNNEMFAGNICKWMNDVSYTGRCSVLNAENTITYIKKVVNA